MVFAVLWECCIRSGVRETEYITGHSLSYEGVFLLLDSCNNSHPVIKWKQIWRYFFAILKMSRLLRKLAHWLKEMILCFCWKYCDRNAPEMFSISWEIVIQCNKSTVASWGCQSKQSQTMINYHKLVAFLLTVLEVRILKSVPWGKNQAVFSGAARQGLCVISSRFPPLQHSLAYCVLLFLALFSRNCPFLLCVVKSPFVLTL